MSYIRHKYGGKTLDGAAAFMMKCADDFEPADQRESDRPGGPRRSQRPLRPPTFSPLYQQIKGLITQGLESGEWKPGEIIPSEVELAARYKVSQGTVRKAIDELAAENLLVRRQGKGTFVANAQRRPRPVPFSQVASR